MDHSTLPPEISLDHAMTADNLYATWYARTENLKLMGMKEYVYFHWTMGTPFRAFEKVSQRSDSKNMLGMMSLAELSAIVHQMNKSPSWWPFAQMYAVPTEKGLGWVNAPQDQKVLLKANPNDLRTLEKEGQDILISKNYKKVFFDYRPVCDGKPSDWIHVMRNPSNAMARRSVFA